MRGEAVGVPCSTRIHTILGGKVYVVREWCAHVVCLGATIELVEGMA